MTKWPLQTHRKTQNTQNKRRNILVQLLLLKTFLKFECGKLYWIDRDVLSFLFYLDKPYISLNINSKHSGSAGITNTSPQKVDYETGFCISYMFTSLKSRMCKHLFNEGVHKIPINLHYITISTIQWCYILFILFRCHYSCCVLLSFFT